MRKQLQFLLLGFFLVTSCSKEDAALPPSPGRVIKSFQLEEGQHGDASINVTDRKVFVKVSSKADLTALVPLIGISEGATIVPESGEKIDVSQTLKQEYEITAASGLKENWEVLFQVVSLNLADYGTYTIHNVASGHYLAIAGDLLQNDKYWDNALMELQQEDSPESDIKIWQKWHLIYHSSDGELKYYRMRNLHSGKYLTVPEDTNEETISAFQISFLNDDMDRQLWRIEETLTGSLEIISKSNGLALSTKDNNTDKGVQIVLKPAENLEGQKWAIESVANAAYRDDEVVNFFNRNESYLGSAAFDQGTSVFLSWGPNAGKTLWITQDAWDGEQLQENKMFSCGHFFRYGNSMFVQPSTTNWKSTDAPNISVPDHQEGRPRQIATIQPGQTFAWPGPGIEIDDKIYINVGEGNGLTGEEQSLLILTQSPGLEWTKERVLVPGMSGQDSEDEIGYATGMVKPGDGYVYAFGNKGFSFGYMNYLHVARFAESDPLKWTFWNGAEWADSPSIAPEARIGEGLGTITVSYRDGKYIMLTMDQGFNCDDERNVYMSTANSPTGPFTERKMVYSITEYLHGQYTRYYTPAIHPQFDNGRNELLFTYSVNFEACGQEPCDGAYLNPYYYRVKGVRVPYEMIGL